MEGWEGLWIAASGEPLACCPSIGEGEGLSPASGDSDWRAVRSSKEAERRTGPSSSCSS